MCFIDKVSLKIMYIDRSTFIYILIYLKHNCFKKHELIHYLAAYQPNFIWHYLFHWILIWIVDKVSLKNHDNMLLNSECFLPNFGKYYI